MIPDGAGIGRSLCRVGLGRLHTPAGGGSAAVPGKSPASGYHTRAEAIRPGTWGR